MPGRLRRSVHRGTRDREALVPPTFRGMCNRTEWAQSIVSNVAKGSKRTKLHSITYAYYVRV